MAVLSIQSKVVAGYAGNSAASFCLQRSGIDCWGIDTLCFSNHTGYDGFEGEVFPAARLAKIFSGLERYVGLEKCSAVLSGYLGRKETGDFVLRAVEAVKKATPESIYCCDPVMGDDGAVYVASDIPDFMREKAVPAADIIIPNRFELSVLTRQPVDDEQSAVRLARCLAVGAKPKIVVVTGVPVAGGLATLAVLEDVAFRVVTPFLDGLEASGCGDMTSALFLAQWLKTKSVPLALSTAVSSAYGILRTTVALKSFELCLIESQNEIETPSDLFQAQTI